jgi:hypothetical protein
MTNQLVIERMKARTLRAFRSGTTRQFNDCVAWLDANWHDDAAAFRFYTAIERESEIDAPRRKLSSSADRRAARIVRGLPAGISS